MPDLRRVRQYLMNEATILAANVLVSSYFDYCKSFQKYVHAVSTWLNCSVFKTDLLRLSQTIKDSHRYLDPILEQLHWLPVKFCHILKTATLVYELLHSGHPSYFSTLVSNHC